MNSPACQPRTRWRDSPEIVAIVVLLVFAGGILPDSNPLSLGYAGNRAGARVSSTVQFVRGRVHQGLRVVHSSVRCALNI